MSAKHTKGPWTASRRAVDIAIEASASNASHTAPRGQPLAYVVGRGVLAPVQEADARLIAAAPDLLELLQAVCDQALARRELVIAQGGKVTWGEEAGELYERSRAVIAKATGSAA